MSRFYESQQADLSDAINDHLSQDDSRTAPEGDFHSTRSTLTIGDSNRAVADGETSTLGDSMSNLSLGSRSKRKRSISTNQSLEASRKTEFVATSDDEDTHSLPVHLDGMLTANTPRIQNFDSDADKSRSTIQRNTNDQSSTGNWSILPARAVQGHQRSSSAGMSALSSSIGDDSSDSHSLPPLGSVLPTDMLRSHRKTLSGYSLVSESIPESDISENHSLPSYWTSMPESAATGHKKTQASWSSLSASHENESVRDDQTLTSLPSITPDNNGTNSSVNGAVGAGNAPEESSAVLALSTWASNARGNGDSAVPPNSVSNASPGMLVPTFVPAPHGVQPVGETGNQSRENLSVNMGVLCEDQQVDSSAGRNPERSETGEPRNSDASHIASSAATLTQFGAPVLPSHPVSNTPQESRLQQHIERSGYSAPHGSSVDGFSTTSRVVVRGEVTMDRISEVSTRDEDPDITLSNLDHAEFSLQRGYSQPGRQDGRLPFCLTALTDRFRSVFSRVNLPVLAVITIVLMASTALYGIVSQTASRQRAQEGSLLVRGTNFVGDIPSSAPSASPSAIPSVYPSDVPTMIPSEIPSGAPSKRPSQRPSVTPSTSPTKMPSTSPTSAPSTSPSSAPSSMPSPGPTGLPSFSPSLPPTGLPSASPSLAPTYTSISFYVMGDVPYSNNEAQQLKKDISRLSSNADFIVHVGDMNRAIDSNCVQQVYQDVEDILKDAESPVFIVPGDNDIWDCPDPSEAEKYWKRHLLGLERNWRHPINVQRQPERLENFAFFIEPVLFVGLNIIEGSGGGSDERTQRRRDNMKWLFNWMDLYSEHMEGLVVFAHKEPSDDFYEPFGDFVENLEVPALYIHGNGHTWEYDTEAFGADNLVRIQVDNGGAARPIKITFQQAAFEIDRRL